MDQVGRVLDAVEDNGLSESTVIMFVGDHGYQMGEHSEWLKNNNFEISHRAPMLLHVPGVIDQVGGDLYPHPSPPSSRCPRPGHGGGQPRGVCGHPAHPGGGRGAARPRALPRVLPQRVHLQVVLSSTLQCCRSEETVCREGMSLLGLYNGDDWKDAIFWQQPVRYNTDSYYQGR